MPTATLPTPSDGRLSILVLWLALAQIIFAQLPVDLFVDEYCKYASPVNPKFVSPLNTCVVTPGAWGIKPASLVCPDGTAVRLIWYRSAGCSDDGTWGSSGFCSNDYPTGPVAGYVAFCGAKNQLQITATTTIPVGTNIISTSKAANTATSSRATGSTTTQAAGATDSSFQPGDKPHGWSALSNGERIGAIIAISIGIPSVIISLVICIQRK